MSDKMKIIQEVENNPNETKTDIAKRLKIPLSTLATIVGKKQEIVTTFMRAGPSGVKRSRAQDGQFADLEQALFSWLKLKQAQCFPISGPMLQEKALDFAKQLNITGDFKASMGWVQKFKARHGIIGRTYRGKSAGVDDFEEPPQWSDVDKNSGVAMTHFVACDNDPTVCALHSDENIKVELDLEDAEGGSDESGSDDKELVTTPTFAQTASAFEVVKSFIYSKDISEEYLKVFLECERILYSVACKPTK